jgi:hypothetical protein
MEARFMVSPFISHVMKSIPCSRFASMEPVNIHSDCIYTYINRVLAWIIPLSGIRTFMGRQDPHGEAGVVAIFTGQMLKHQPVTIYGTGEQVRDFVYVEDLCRKFVEC